MNTATIMFCLFGWLAMWFVCLTCGVGVFYFWRKGEPMPFVVCIIGAILVAIPLFTIAG